MTFDKVLALAAALSAAGPAIGQEAVEAVQTSDGQVQLLPADADADAGVLRQQAIEGINAFSLDLYRRTLPAGGNHFLSPASVSVAMGLAYRGARGTTAEELDRTMHFGRPPRDYLRANGYVLDTMDLSGPGRELRTANALWLQEGMPLDPGFAADIASHARAGMQRVNFRKDPDAARVLVNQWVAGRTRDRITGLLEPADVTKYTRAILVNAIYWKGAWNRPFDKAATRPEPFTLLGGEKREVPLMNQRAHFQVAERRGTKAILLPYAGQEIEMAVFLPSSPKGLPRFEAKLTAAELSRFLHDLTMARPRETILTLPRMHVEWREDLKDSLKAMGAPTAFSDNADFLGMASPDYPGELENAVGFKIAHVIHKTYLDVDEIGSEAVAATAVVSDIVISSRGQAPPPPPPFVFRADKPFLFLLRDRRTGLILFMGRYVAP